MTAPGVAQTIILTRTPGRTPMPPGEELAKLARIGATLCIFLSSDRIGEVARTLAAHYGQDCPAACVYHASWKDQKIVRGTLTDIAGKMQEAAIVRTAMVIVGRTLTRPLAEASRLYDAKFTHGYRKGSQP